jgi:hypothetical protein
VVVHEEEISRAGVTARLSFQRTRWYDGRVLTWLGIRADWAGWGLQRTGVRPSPSGKTGRLAIAT